jgi:cytochrome c553
MYQFLLSERELLMRVHSMRAYMAAIATGAFMVLGAQTAFAAQAASGPSFKQEVEPIFAQHCIQCHMPGQIGHQAIGLDLTTYHGVMSGSRHGPAVIPRHPQLGTLMKVLDWSKPYHLKMPPLTHELSQQDLNTIRAWILAGAKND